MSKFFSRATGSKNSIIQEYVLPDFTKRNKGYILSRDEKENLTSRKADGTDQILTMNNERFMIPEILFNPSDIGMNQAGIPEAIFQSVEACDPDSQGLLYANVVIVGGNANLPGFKQRVQSELRHLVPAEYDVRVAIPEK
ncbi:Actin-related protein 6 [Umbelopsis sp. WA50703]